MAGISPELLELLQCPESSQSLHVSNQKLSTDDGTIEYPFVDGIPWLLKNPEYFRNYWGAKKSEYLNFHKLNILKIEDELKQIKSSVSTAWRLKILKQGHEHNFKELSELLKPLDSKDPIAMTVAVPSHQSLSLYRKNIFRDWGWETDENRVGLDLVKSLLGASWKPKNFCVLGSGASRLAMDLHWDYKLSMTVAVDFNPLLLFVAQKMYQRKSFSLYDFPSAPLESDTAAKLFEIATSLPRLSGFHFVFGDVTFLPFKPARFDSVLTPWLIDILPMSFKLFAQRVNQVMTVGGSWINFGPLGFSHREESLNLTSEEIIEQLADNGFQIEAQNKASIKYLSSIDEVNSRNESVFLFKAKKIKNVEIDPFELWPEWLRSPNLPVPQSDDLLKHQQLIRFQADLFHSIDGQLSINQLSQLFAAHYKIPIEAALKMTTNVLRQFEESLKRKS